MRTIAPFVLQQLRNTDACGLPLNNFPFGEENRKGLLISRLNNFPFGKENRQLLAVKNRKHYSSATKIEQLAVNRPGLN
jgi:hypothetical protein